MRRLISKDFFFFLIFSGEVAQPSLAKTLRPPSLALNSVPSKTPKQSCFHVAYSKLQTQNILCFCIKLCPGKTFNALQTDLMKHI